LDIPIKNVTSVAAAGCPDAIHRLFTDLMGEDVMCCRWPAPPLPHHHPANKKQSLLSISLASRTKPSKLPRQNAPKTTVRQVGQNQRGLVTFNVAWQRDVRRQKIDTMTFQGHTRFQRLCSVHLRHGKQHRTSKLRLILNLRNNL